MSSITWRVLMMRTNGINNDIAQTETGFECLGRVHDERITSIWLLQSFFRFDEIYPTIYLMIN